MLSILQLLIQLIQIRQFIPENGIILINITYLLYVAAFSQSQQNYKNMLFLFQSQNNRKINNSS